jgi:hypothetical protein
MREYVEDLLNHLKYQNPQHEINGMNNQWIVKPGDMSRGREIKLFNDFFKMMHHIGMSSIKVNQSTFSLSSGGFGGGSGDMESP